MCKHPLIARILFAGIFFSSAVVLADPIVIESIHDHSDLTSDKKCSKPHEQLPGGWVKGQPRELILFGVNDIDIEVFGHGIDAWIDGNEPSNTNHKPNVRLTGFGGQSPRFISGTNGPANIVRGCGGIGSAHIRLNIGNLQQITRGTLTIADAAPFAVVFYPRVITDLEWHRSNTAVGASNYDAALAAYNANLPAAQAAYNACLAQEAADRAAADAARQALIAQNPNATFVEMGSPSSGCHMPPPPVNRATGTHNRTIADCAESAGLIASISGINGKRLSVTLPPSGISSQCAQKYLRLDYDEGHQGAALSFNSFRGSWQTVNTTFSSSGTAPTPSFTVVPEDRYVKVTFQSSQLVNLVGSYNREIKSSSGESVNLTLKSNPDYGVARLAGPLFQNLSGQTGKRTASVGRLTMTSVQAAYPGQVFKWVLTGNNAATCFAATSGTFSPVGNSSDTVFQVEATEAVNCSGSSFTVSVGPQGQETNPVFSRNTTFTLPIFEKPLIQSDKPKVSVPAGLQTPIR